jgi:predicted PurR-regulated permease PerM
LRFLDRFCAVLAPNRKTAIGLIPGRVKGRAVWTVLVFGPHNLGAEAVSRQVRGLDANVAQATDLREVFEPTVSSEQAAEEAEILHASIKAGTVAQIVIAVIATIGLIYLLKLVLVTILLSILLAYMLEPLVAWLQLLKIPRWLGALVVVGLTLVLAAGLAYFSYNRAAAFADQLPRYSDKLRDTLAGIRSREIQIENRARSVVDPPADGKQPVPVQVQQPHGLARMISDNSGSIFEVLMAIAFVPFLAYFMLASKDHSHVATVRLFPKEHRMLAHRTVGTISTMIRSYIIANVLVGLLNTVIFALVFWLLGIKYFYFVGAVSGFVSLIPYLGVFLSLLPPLTAGIDVLDKTGIVTVLVVLIGLHVVTMNLVYPKFIGHRLKLNPLAVSVSLLFWAWIWGAPGLILAIPLLSAAKIICDHIEPLCGLGSLLGDSC